MSTVQTKQYISSSRLSVVAGQGEGQEEREEAVFRTQSVAGEEEEEEEDEEEAWREYSLRFPSSTSDDAPDTEFARKKREGG